MRRVRKVDDPSKATEDALKVLQKEVDDAGDYAQRVAQAKSLWGSKTNRTVNKEAFAEIRERLAAACWGAERCNYCEDSRGDEIEHFRPKDLFPEVAFAWSNYLYACGSCNGPKNNQFAVFATPGSAVITEIARKKNDPVVPPIKGDAVLIDPRTEDPLDFLRLDLETLWFQPRLGGPTASRENERAKYTIKTLRLNERESLIQGRATTLILLKSALCVAAAKRLGLATFANTKSEQAVWNTPHRFVWEEMKRQRAQDQDLGRLFEIVPEALDW